MERKPFVAGRFYPAQPLELKQALDSYLERDQPRSKVPGIIVPHAGYMYSGKVAGAVYSKVALPETIVIIGPNHSGLGAPVSVYPPGHWETPLGLVTVATELAQRVANISRYVSLDATAHMNEHSIEVQLPFIQLLRPNANILPIALGDYHIETLEDLMDTLDEATAGMDVLFIASSDFSHYEPEYTAKAHDKMAIEEIKKMDWRALHRVVTEKDITMCGLGPICVACELSKRRGAESGRLLAYSNSGVMSHDYSNVVTYAGIAFK